MFFFFIQSDNRTLQPMLTESLFYGFSSITLAKIIAAEEKKKTFSVSQNYLITTKSTDLT